jgi:hypothetical protein
MVAWAMGTGRVLARQLGNQWAAMIYTFMASGSACPLSLHVREYGNE